MSSGACAVRSATKLGKRPKRCWLLVVRRWRGLLHAERLSLQHLTSLRRSMGERKFEAQYQQAPVPAEVLRQRAQGISVVSLGLGVPAGFRA